MTGTDDDGSSDTGGRHGPDGARIEDLHAAEEVRERLADTAEGWKLVYRDFDPGTEGLREALCTVGNGHFCTRGAAPEARADGVHYPGTYRAGCYDRLATTIAGETVENESLVNLPNWLPLTFRAVGGTWLDLQRWEVLDYHQELDLERGVLLRQFRVRDEAKRVSRVRERRFVSMGARHRAGLETTVTAENWSGRLEVRAGLDARVENAGVERYRALEGKHLVPVGTWSPDPECMLLRARTVQSRIDVAAAARLRVFREGSPVSPEREIVREPGYMAHGLGMEISEAEAVTIEKMVTLCTSRDPAISEAGETALRELERSGSFDEELDRHRRAWAHRWRRYRTETDLPGREEEWTNCILRLHLFHLLQTVSDHTVDLDVGIPARGWHGEAYRGHVFWDELFILPILNFRAPELTRELLRYRYRRLPEARRLARDAGYRGAAFPWQSGSDGREESQELHLNPESGRWIPDDTHLQRHIDAAIAYNVWRHYRVTGDREFLDGFGAEMMLSIARFWSSIAELDEDRGRHVIRGVVGPDEYHTAYPDADEPGLDNNAYTNAMAAWVLARARDALDELPDYRARELRQRLGLDDAELERWDEVSRNLFVPFHGGGEIISQFEGYDELEEFDWAAYREKYGDIQRLDRILEAEGDTPNRYRASKQADVLMLFYLFSAEELTALFHRLGYDFDPASIPRNVEYYMERTSHGSTLSGVVHSWVLSRTDRERSWRFFREALVSDVGDVQGGTTPEGIHLGAMAGTVDLLQRCYSGLEVRGERLLFNPLLPDELRELSFRVRFRGHWIDVTATPDRLRVEVGAGESAPVTVGVADGPAVTLEPGEWREFEL